MQSHFQLIPEAAGFVQADDKSAALALISRALRNDGTINQIQGARNREALLAMVTNLWDQDAA